MRSRSLGFDLRVCVAEPGSREICENDTDVSEPLRRFEGESAGLNSGVDSAEGTWLFEN